MPRIQHKRGTSANLASVNPTPLAGEFVWDSTENAIKIGDGATAWTSLAYVTATPRTHTHSADAITSGTVAYARLPVGSTTSTVCAGDDARLTDARTPTAHKSSHSVGGSDALTPADIGAAPAASPAITGNATFEASSGVPVTITNTGTGNSFVVNDASGDTTPFFVDADGNVGIATPTAIARLDCAATTGTGMRVVQSGATNSNVGLFQFTGGSVGSTGAASALLRVLTNGTIRRLASFNDTTVITAAGDLGVKTTAPATALDVNGVITVAAGTAAAPALVFSGDSNTGIAQIGGADSWSVVTGGVERMRVRADGNVALGSAGFATARQAIGGSISQVGSSMPANLYIHSSMSADSAQAAKSAWSVWSAATPAASQAFTNFGHFYVAQSIAATGSDTTNHFGFYANVAGAANNIGFYGGASNAAGNWNFYAGTFAPNYFAGNVGIGSGTTSPTAALDINADKIRLRTAKTPASASDTGNAGDICWDASYLYICTATNTWRRIAHDTW